MANKLITPTLVTAETLRVLHNNMGLAKRVTRQYEKNFFELGVKAGTVINVRIPNQYYVTKGQAITVQNSTESTIPISLNTQSNIAFEFSSVELTTSVEQFSKRYLTPIANKLAQVVDSDGFTMVNQNTFNQVGTPGTTPGSASGGAGLLVYTSPQIILNAGMMLNHMSTPRDNMRTVLYNPAAEGGIISSLTGLFQDSSAIAEQYITGTMGTAMGFDFAMSQNVQNLTTGTHAGTGVVNGNNQTGSSLITNGWTASSAIFNAGEVITIGSGATAVNAVNPENQNSIGQLQYFVVTANVVADANGNATIPISPAIIPTGATVANGTVTASPVTGAVVNALSGSASTTYPINLAYHADAFTLVTADMPMPEGAEFAARENFEGIAMRIWRDRDIRSDSFPCRVDLLYGWAPIRPQFACRIAG